MSWYLLISYANRDFIRYDYETIIINKYVSCYDWLLPWHGIS